jgi:mannose-6-phosphate isomerase
MIEGSANQTVPGRACGLSQVGSSIVKMAGRLVDKPWGQEQVRHLKESSTPSRRIGEVCFEHPASVDLPVQIKYLYTSERLSVQVHPNNQQAQQRGYATGKDEMWIVLDAEPGATIGLGLKRDADPQELGQAVLDGSIENLVDWRRVRRGDVIYNTAGTIHAAGAGLVLLEVQQAIDLTYRLYDYGRPRELHLVDGLAVARRKPHFDARDCSVADGQSRILADGPYFGAAWCAGELPCGIPLSAHHWQLVVVEGAAHVAGIVVDAGECCLVRSLSDIRLGNDTVALIAWPVSEALAHAA